MFSTHFYAAKSQFFVFFFLEALGLKKDKVMILTQQLTKDKQKMSIYQDTNTYSTLRHSL